MPQQNNDFTHDTDGQHIERCETLFIGIDAHGAALSFSAADITKIKTYCTDIKAAMLALAKEKADVDEVFVELHAAEAAARIKYTACQDYVRGEMQVAEAGTAEYMNERFNIHGGAPDRREDFINEADEMIDSYTNILTEHPDVTLAPALFDELTALIAALRVAKNAVPIERAQESEASVVKRVLMETTGYSILRWVFNRAKSFWGDDDPRLLELGFVPKSMIWTPGSGEPEPGGNETPWGMVQGLEVSIDPIGNIYIKWKKVATAEKYTLLREVVPIGSPAPVLPYSVYMTGIPPFEEFVAYSDTDHDPGFAYYYSVVAVNVAGEETEACPPKGIEVV